MNKIHFLSRIVTEQITPGPNCAVISIGTPCDSKGPAELSSAWASVLYVSFFDSLSENGLPAHWYFNQDIAKELLDFVDSIVEVTDELVIHCDLGISRSAAIALFIGSMYGVPVFRHGAPVNPNYDQYNTTVYKQLSLARLAKEKLGLPVATEAEPEG